MLASDRNKPLGLSNARARTSHSSFPVDAPWSPDRLPAPRSQHDKKRTSDGAIILDPQPEESANDPLNWPSWRRDTALLSLGFYCMIGGGITPLIAAGFTDVARDYHVDVEAVSLTTGLYMMGLGLGSVLASPTAILFGKRPVYLASAIVFIATCLWAAWSLSFSSLLAARVFQGLAISPVECLPSATIAEIFFLHERAYRIGIYTLLLLGGKNLVPLVSAAIIGRFGWRWVFWCGRGPPFLRLARLLTCRDSRIVAMVVGLGFVLLFLFVPETFWDRTPTRRASRRPSFLRRLSSRRNAPHPDTASAVDGAAARSPGMVPPSTATARRPNDQHVGFARPAAPRLSLAGGGDDAETPATPSSPLRHVGWSQDADAEKRADEGLPETPTPRTVGSPGHASRRLSVPAADTNVHEVEVAIDGPGAHGLASSHRRGAGGSVSSFDCEARRSSLDKEKIAASRLRAPPKIQAYTHNLRQQPARTFVQQLRPYHGRLNHDKWLKVMARSFILFAYPAVLWSAAIYACSIGWLIVISETMAVIYRDPKQYNFNALQTGLVYISPFVGGILGTGVAGRVSDVVVRIMSRRNGGLYEPEFRLVMALPVLVTTCIGLMGFGWSAQERDHWIVPTLFFGVLSFGCALGSTTSITFCVDSYRQYAGEALVTLNFYKNVLHGLVFSLFVSHWMKEDGPKRVYIWLGIIQLLLCLLTVPLYIYGKRARMWTVRRNLMEKF